MIEDKYSIINGDCIEVLKTLPENHIDAIVTDPPYGLAFMGKSWDSFKSNDDYREFSLAWSREALRVLKPGGYLLSFSGTRTYHWMAVGIEQAGFNCRDMIEWIYGSGFPKSLNISKALDKSQGAERGKIRHKARPESSGTMSGATDTRPWIEQSRKLGYHEVDDNHPVTDDAKYWDGYGTALKPAQEPIMVAQKPISERTIAANCLRWGVGALNIDSCRISTEEIKPNMTRKVSLGSSGSNIYGKGTSTTEYRQHTEGRWPANVIHDGSEEVVKNFPQSSFGNKLGGYSYAGKSYEVDGFVKDNKPKALSNYGDSGSAARFFYSPKTSVKERHAGLDEKSSHPTVKPIELMKYLVRLVTPHNGIVLDPFLGSGSTGIAALLENKKFIGIEKSEEFFKIADMRIKHFISKGENN